MSDFIRLLTAIIALIRSIIQSDKYETPDEVRAAIEKAIKDINDAGVVALMARFEAVFRSRYFDNRGLTQWQAFVAGVTEVKNVAATYLFAAQAFVILEGHIVDPEILKILGITFDDDDGNSPTPKPKWMRGEGPKWHP
jgi:hypothetical protein